MTPWSMRPLEQRTLLNPGFCSMLLWHAAIGHEDAPGAAGPMPLELAFVVLPIVLHRETRELLPSKASTSMAVWLEDHALARSRIAQRAPMLVPFVREALLFGGLHGFLRFQDATGGCRARLEEEGPKGSEGHNGRSRDLHSKGRVCGQVAWACRERRHRDDALGVRP